MRVAILGAGFQGVCVALELSRRGLEVDLFDRNDRPITQAGLINEGRIHFGFIYANDPSMRTAELMARGALSFRALLNRWIDFDPELSNSSGPTLYAVHRDSLVELSAIRKHFEQLGAWARDWVRREGGDYLGGQLDSIFQELDPIQTEALFDRRIIRAAFQTLERCVRADRIAGLLREAVKARPAIHFRPRTRIVAARRVGDWIEIEATRDGAAFRRPYRQVVNALWDGRMVLDAMLGYPPGRSWLHRFKYGIRLHEVPGAGELPSVAILLGPFGELVRFPNRDLYLSWYPTCVAAVSKELAPPDWPQEPEPEQAQRIYRETLQALACICPALRSLDGANPPRMSVQGGTIVAWGSSDIHDPRSRLHSRSEIGPFSENGYHSINTGKYTLAPLFALQVANRICGAE